MPERAKRAAAQGSCNEDFWDLKLYVMDKTPRSMLGIGNLKRICGEFLKGHYRIKVLDLKETPKLAFEDRIVAIPTLIRVLATSRRRIIGDLSDKEKVLRGLDIIARPAGECYG